MEEGVLVCRLRVFLGFLSDSPSTVCLKTRLTQGLSCRVLGVVSWSLLWATHRLPCRAPAYRGRPRRDPPVCHRVQGDSGQSANPSWCGVLGVVTSSGLCVRVPSSCATENTHLPARLEALFQLSIVIILSHLHQISAGFGCFLQ